MPSERPLRLSSCTVDRTTRIVVSRSGETCTLTDLEVRLLGYLVDQSPRVVPRDELLTAVWDYRPGVDNRGVVDAMLRLLRRKVEATQGNPQHVVTVRGRGYQFVGSGPRAESVGQGQDEPNVEGLAVRAVVALCVCHADQLWRDVPLAFAAALEMLEAGLRAPTAAAGAQVTASPTGACSSPSTMPTMRWLWPSTSWTCLTPSPGPKVS